MHVVLLISPVTCILLLFIAVTCYIDYPVIYSSYLPDTCTLTYMTIVLSIWRMRPPFLSHVPVRSCHHMSTCNESTWGWGD